MSFATAANVFAQNRVLRNTFFLLALSFITTIAGTIGGIMAGLPAWGSENPVTFAVISLVGAIGLIFLTHAFRDDALGVPLFLAFSLFEGGAICGLINQVWTNPGGPMIIANAFAGTALVTVGCSIYAMVTKRDFSVFGGFLFGSLLALLGLMVLALVFGFYGTWISYLAIPLFSFYLIWDVQRVVDGGEDNYISAAIGIYLDVLNIFLHMLNIGKDD